MFLLHFVFFPSLLLPFLVGFSFCWELTSSSGLVPAALELPSSFGLAPLFSWSCPFLLVSPRYFLSWSCPSSFGLAPLFSFLEPPFSSGPAPLFLSWSCPFCWTSPFISFGSSHFSGDALSFFPLCFSCTYLGHLRRGLFILRTVTCPRVILLCRNLRFWNLALGAKMARGRF